MLDSVSLILLGGALLIGLIGWRGLRAAAATKGRAATVKRRRAEGQLLAVAAILLVIALLPSIRKGRDEVFTE